MSGWRSGYRFHLPVILFHKNKIKTYIIILRYGSPEIDFVNMPIKFENEQWYIEREILDQKRKVGK